MSATTGAINLRPQDLAVALKLAIHRQRSLVLTQLADELGMPLSSIHGAVRRAEQARLISRADGTIRALRPAVLEFSVHGAKYAYPALLGAPTRGMPTAVGGPVLAPQFAPGEEVPVWPTTQGKVRGPGLSPLYPGAPGAAEKDPDFYAVLTLVDALRVGAARERALAIEGLQARLA